MRSLFLCALALSVSSAQATSITATNSFIFTSTAGSQTCAHSGSAVSNCAAADPSGRAIANAIATARPGYVSVALNGGSTIYGSFASASSTATSTESYVFTNGAGPGTLMYSVALSGASNGNPADPSTVLFNGASYSVLPFASPTYYSFTQSFLYGQPFVLTLSLDLRGSWNGTGAESGSRVASAELKSLEIFSTVSASALTPAPEPSTAIMWIGGLLLILAGTRLRRKQR